MGFESKQTTIDGTTYEVSMLPYKTGRKLLLKIYKVFGPALGKALANAPDVQKGASMGDVKIADLAPAFSAILEQLAEGLSEQDYEYMVDTLAQQTWIIEGSNRQQLCDVIDLHFAGKYLEQFKWLAFALKVNYGGFMRGQGALGALLDQAKKVVNASQSGSIGASTGSQAPSDTPQG